MATTDLSVGTVRLDKNLVLEVDFSLLALLKCFPALLLVWDSVL
jgi:hypothetical protein